MNETETKQANEVMDALESVIDPELGIDIVNLGLIYGVEVEGTQCTITMTLTTMGCPLSDMINNDITQATESVDGVESCDINLVWYPIWDMTKMSRFAKIALGIHG
ncbi:metal-sulfur cluster assembly factor [Companilactobacillus mishanensis]|uniref:Metal-sulfur cluster assembly factor n=1 Tax=Companilactobacillus mishanensis TaxID=2486008 RepID=A0A5P0ZI76_9LACO|nr:metal-sulfur cluster assembly factor [Companilactobacillus mishanensis]MQS45885.1 metal-sulfur cluster assembly factor [Companilactobacillus mishanensis]MQS52796.1 metal-sulfur cluster assembly factor [Companilactobacillus mishanensis]